MKKIFDFINEKITPFATKLSQNVWIASLQEAIIVTLPLTLVGSMVSVLSILNEFIEGFPDFSPINTFSFGLIGLVVAFILPVFVLQRKKMDGKKYMAGFASVGMFLMLLSPMFNDEGQIILQLENLGASGMFLGIISGYLTSFVFVSLDKVTFFGKDGAVPDYIVSSFDSFIPILVNLSISWLIIYVLKVDFFNALTVALSPLTTFGQSYWGLLAYVLVTTIMYSFGISPWLLYGLFYPIQLAGISQNAELVAKGLMASNINTGEVVQSFISLGGMGTTLPLAFMMLKAKSTKNKAIGKASIVPSLLNINEPLVFGAPILLNPLLMIPFCLNSFVVPTIVYFALKLGFVTIPSKIFMLWFIPTPIQAYLSNYDWRSIVLVAVVLVVSSLIWYPFFKAYDQQQVQKELENN